MTADTGEHAVYSVTRSIEYERPVAASGLTAAVSGWVEDLGSWARERGYLVGHIKVLLEYESDCASISGTGGTPTVRTYGRWERMEITTVDLKATAIILGPTESELCVEASERLDRLMKQGQVFLSARTGRCQSMLSSECTGRPREENSQWTR